MPPTIPCFRSPRGRCAADAITVSSSSSSSSGSEQSITNTLVIVSSSSSSSGSEQSATTNTLLILSSASATFSTGNVVVVVPDSPASRGGAEARGGGQRSAPRRQRPPSAVPVRSPTVVTAAASSASGGGHVGTSRRAAPPPHQCPSPRSVLSVRAPGGVALAAPPSSGGRVGVGDDDEATSRPKRKVLYRKWDVVDERKILNALAELRRENLDERPQASALLKRIQDHGGLRRQGVVAQELSDKVYRLKLKFLKAMVGRGARRRPKYRDQVLYDASKEAWPGLLRRSRARNRLRL